MTPTWQSDDGSVRLFLGSCFDVLPRITADVTITDPPYGIGFAPWDMSVPDGAWLVRSREFARTTLVIPRTGQIWKYPEADWTLCWFRPGSTQRTPQGKFSHWEPILVYGEHRMWCDAKKFNANTGAKGIDHPCPKPLALMEWLVEGTTDKGETVCDPFMGSCTTGEAAIRLGRRFVGVELSPEYFWDLCVPRAKRALAERAAQLPFVEGK